MAKRVIQKMGLVGSYKETVKVKITLEQSTKAQRGVEI
jgi:hypothetical protein